MKELSKMSEEELRNYKTPFPESIAELNNIIYELEHRNHDYGTCVYAMSIAAEATFNYMSGKLGCTGFQASCADIDFLGRTRNLKDGFRIIDYKKIFYPQYHEDINNISVTNIINDNLEGFTKKAEKLLSENNNASPEVIANWRRIVSMGRGTKIEKMLDGGK